MDAATGKEHRRLESGNGVTGDLAFSPDGKVLAEVFNGPSPQVRLWDVASGKQERALASGTRETCPRFSPDGSLLVTCNLAKNSAIRFWEAATGKEVHALRTNERIHSLALSPDGKVLATGGDKITLYSLTRDKPLGVQIGAPRLVASSLGTVTALAFSPDGRLLASSNGDATIHLWETASGKERSPFQRTYHRTFDDGFRGRSVALLYRGRPPAGFGRRR